MKKILFIAIATLFILAGCSSSSSYDYELGDTLPAGSYVFGEDIKPYSYMYNLNGESTFKITDDQGNEVFYYEVAAGQSQHAHSLPVDENYVIEITGSGGMELV